MQHDEKVPVVLSAALKTPTWAEWNRATQYEREKMTWPQEILEQIGRERP